MGKRTFAVIVIVFVLLAVAAAAIHTGDDGMIVRWLRHLHGR